MDQLGDGEGLEELFLSIQELFSNLVIGFLGKNT